MILDHLIAEIRRAGTMRTPALGLFADMPEDILDARLAPLCAPGGPLVSCDVQSGEERVKEYRCSTIGGGKLNDTWTIKPGRPRKHPAEDTEAGAGFGGRAVTKALNDRFQKPAAPHLNHVPPTAPKPTTPRKETAAPMTTASRIIAVITKRGPMTIPQIRSIIDEPHVATTCSQLVKRKQLLKLAGGAKTSVYGLPGQKAPAGAAAKVKTKAPGKAKRAKGGAPSSSALVGIGFTALTAERMRDLLAAALGGERFELTVGETRELATAAFLNK